MDRQDHGTLIAIEGIDGAGKTTQVGLLEQFFCSVGEDVVRSKEPTDGKWGQKIRASANNGRMSLADEIHAFTEDRKEHVRNLIGPALAAGRIVILDRYYYSTIAYQGSHGGDVEAIETIMRGVAPEPDAVIILDVAPEIGLARIEQGRGEIPNAFETPLSLRAARCLFQGLAKDHENISVIDGTQDAASVHRNIVWTLIDGALKSKHCAKQYGCEEPMHCEESRLGNCRWSKMLQRYYLLKLSALQQ
jgi:dTMP kinase